MTDQVYESHSDSEIPGIYDDMPELEGEKLEDDDVEDLEPVDGHVFVTMRSLSINTVPEQEVQ